VWRPDSRLGFTIIEILVSVGIIAILLALLLPSLHSARIRGDELRSTINARSNAAAIDAYADRSKGAFPIPVAGEVYPTGCENQWLGFSRWATVYNWPQLVFSDEELRVAIRNELISPRRVIPPDRGDCGYVTSYALARSLLAPPDAWDDPPLPVAMNTPSATRSQVVFPSRKALLWDSTVSYRPQPPLRNGDDLAVETPVAFLDGHVKPLRPIDARTPTNAPGGSGSPASRLHDTPNGVRGIDY